MALEKEPQGAEGEFGYQEYDSADFEDHKSEDGEEAEHSDDGKPAKNDGKASKQSEPEEKTDEEREDATDGEGSPREGGDAASGESEKPAADDSKSEKYVPNLKFKVYGEERDIPKEFHEIIKDKASEDLVRSVLCKAEAFEPQQAKHQEVVRDRDQQKAMAETLKTNAERIMGLRDKNQWLFFKELGVTDQMIVRAAREIVDASDPQNPARAQQFNQMREAEWQAHNARIEAESNRRSADNVRLHAHEQAFNTAMNAPHIADFERRFDAHYKKPGAFRDVVMAHGNYCVHTRGYLPPMTVIQEMYDFHSAGLPTTQSTTQATQTSGGSPQGTGTPSVRPRPQGLVTPGRGKAATPVGAKPKRLKDLKEYAKREIAKMNAQG